MKGKTKSKILLKELPVNDRPREKLFRKGSENLTDSELLAIILGTGAMKKDALQLSEIFLQKFPLSKLAQITCEQVPHIYGIGKGKRARIFAMLELGKRMYAAPSLLKTTLKSQKEIIQECKDIANKKQEYLLALYLNARKELIQKEIIAIGNVNTMGIEPKEIFIPAIVTPCSEIILAHNHPSGNVMPSTDDIYFTKRVQEAGNVMGIQLQDHIIVAAAHYYSFRDNKMYSP